MKIELRKNFYYIFRFFYSLKTPFKNHLDNNRDIHGHFGLFQKSNRLKNALKKVTITVKLCILSISDYILFVLKYGEGRIPFNSLRH